MASEASLGQSQIGLHVKFWWVRSRVRVNLGQDTQFQETSPFMAA